jgi:ribosomal protein L34
VSYSVRRHDAAARLQGRESGLRARRAFAEGRAILPQDHRKE